MHSTHFLHRIHAFDLTDLDIYVSRSSWACEILIWWSDKVFNNYWFVPNENKYAWKITKEDATEDQTMARKKPKKKKSRFFGFVLACNEYWIFSLLISRSQRSELCSSQESDTEIMRFSFNVDTKKKNIPFEYFSGLSPNQY